jgi:hypothetical protein
LQSNGSISISGKKKLEPLNMKPLSKEELGTIIN